MKVKVDFVTNSSSEVFGVVVGSSALVGGLVSIIGIFMNSCKEAGERREIYAGQADDLISEAESTAQVIAEAALKDAQRQDEIVKDAYIEAENAIDSVSQALQKEIDEYKKAWAESDKTADKTDTNYEKVNQQYKEYIEYLEGQLQNTKIQKDNLIREKAEMQAAAESKNEWVRQRQADYIAIKEERAMLEAVARGYDKPGYNADAVKERLEQLEKREVELSQVLSKNNASFDYKANEREPIGPSQESINLTNKIIAEREAFEKAAKKADAEKRAELAAEMEKNIAEYEKHIKTDNRYSMALKAAEGVQFGADIAVDGLAYVTGPAGQQVKLAYTAGKAVASGVGEGMADPKNASKHLAKGILSAGTETLKSHFGADKPWQAAATGILNEGLQGALDASIKGEDVLDAVGKGLTKGVFDAGIDKGLDMIKGKIPIPQGTSVDVSDFSVSQVLNNNPLSKGLAKTIGREFAGDKIKDSIKEVMVDKAGKEGGFIKPE